jgi:RimJ/RimL family protein N-acetyltransferase
VIYGKRLRLRAIERADLPRFHEWLNDPEITDGLAIYLPLSMLEEEKWFDRAMEGDEEQRPLAIEIPNGKEWLMIGNAGLLQLEWTNRCSEFGLFIGDKSRWDRGYGTETVQLMLRHAFQTLNLNRIYLRVHANNARARRSYEKAGFVLEGTLREAVYRDGEYRDVYIMSVLRSDWSAGGEAP